MKLLKPAQQAMSHQRQGFYRTIEYIGPRPQRAKRRNYGGWVIIALTLGMACWFGRPLLPSLKASQVTASVQEASLLISSLAESKKFGDGLAAAALAHSGEEVAYDSSYYEISYPDGDVPSGKGIAADVIVRCFRKMGIDLQVLVHEDMTAHFRPYPQLWDASAPDSNIDHRRVPNLQRFFERKGESISVTRNAADYRPGDVVVWSMADGEKHIGIVVPGPSERSKEAWVVHNMGAGVKWENVLFDYSIERHFRFPMTEPAKTFGNL
jgi:uncharacterized protein YijF (DUF1287 family)